MIYYILYWVRSTTGLLGFLVFCGLVLQFVGLFANLGVLFCFVGGQRERRVPPPFIHIFQQRYFETAVVIFMSHRKKKKKFHF